MERRPPSVAATPTQPPLRNSIAYAAVGVTFFNGCRVVVVLLLARYASPAVLGAFDAAMAWTAPIVTFLMLQLRGAYVADAERAVPFRAYFTLRWLAMLLALVAIVGLCGWHVLSGDAPGDGIALATLSLMLLGVGVAKILSALGEVCWGVFQRFERLDLFAWSQALRGVAMAAPFAVLLLWPGLGDLSDASRATAAVIAYALLWGAVAWWYDRPRALALVGAEQAYRRSDLWALTLRTAPLGLVILIITICDSLPRLVIGESDAAGLEQLGYFAAMSNVVLPINLLVIAIGQAAANRAARHFASDRGQFVRLSLKLLGVVGLIGLLLVIGVALFGERLLHTLFPPEYADYPEAFLVIAAGGALLLLGSLLGVIVTAAGHFWVQTWLQIAILLATGVAAWLLIPGDAVNGGAWTYFVRGATQFALYAGTFAVLARSARRNRDA